MTESINCVSGVCSLDQSIYAVGGYDGSSQLSSMERYDVWLDQWTAITPMNCPRSALSVSIVNNCIYAIGKFCWPFYNVPCYSFFEEST